MADRGFLEINNFRSFPLVDGDSLLLKSSAMLPKKGIADAGFMMGIDSQFNVAIDTVTLFSVVLTFSEIRFDFRSSAPGMTGYRWLFAFPLTAPFGCTAQADVTPVSGGSGQPDRGWGFLTVGDLDELLAMGPGTYELNTPPRVEPALIQSLIGTYVRSINIGNTNRPCPTACCEEEEPYDPELVYMLTSPGGISGNVLLKEGHNSQISVNSLQKIIELGGVSGAGMGVTCEDWLVVGAGPSGLQEDDGTLCESCSDYIRSVNGVRTQDGKLILSSSAGVRIITDPAGHKIMVTVETDRICTE